MCQVLKVSRSGYYHWVKYPKSTRKIEDADLIQKINTIYYKNRKTYGSPRIHQVLLKEGCNVSKKRVERLMKKAGIHAVTKKKYRVTTDSKHAHQIAVNHLNRNLKVDKPNKFWVADITYIFTQEGWLYLSTIMDLYFRKIVGWSMKNRITKDLVIEALNMAIKQRKPGRDLLLHSDRGSQYASYCYQVLLSKKGIRCSMSRKGNCWDNAVMESFYRTLKVELIYLNKHKTRMEAKRDIFEYIEIFYNRERLHSFLGYHSPEEYERMTMVA